MANCRACGAEINFIRMTTGKYMPVEAEPVFVVPGESEVRYVSDNGILFPGTEVSENDGTADVAYVPHWSKCTSADRFRKRYGQ